MSKEPNSERSLSTHQGILKMILNRAPKFRVGLQNSKALLYPLQFPHSHVNSVQLDERWGKNKRRSLLAANNAKKTLGSKESSTKRGTRCAQEVIRRQVWRRSSRGVGDDNVAKDYTFFTNRNRRKPPVGVGEGYVSVWQGRLRERFGNRRICIRFKRAGVGRLKLNISYYTIPLSVYNSLKYCPLRWRQSTA